MRMYIKKIAFAILFACIAPVTAFGVMAYTPSRPCCYQQFNPCVTEQYNETHYDDVVTDNDWYVSFFVADNMWSWEDSYDSDWGGVNLSFAKDKYSFESVLGGGIAFGKKFTDFRADLEVGLTSNFVDSDEDFKISMSLPYAMIDVYHDFDSGFYLGAGLGVSRATMELSGAIFENKGVKKSLLSPKVGASAGYMVNISDDVYLDLRFRISWMKGTKVSNSKFLWDEYRNEYEEFYLKVNGGDIIESSLLAGIRFNF